MEQITQKDFDILNEKVDKIYDALMGNDIVMDGGIVERLRRVEGKVDELTAFKDKSKWTATLLISAATLMGYFIDKIFTFFHK